MKDRSQAFRRACVLGVQVVLAASSAIVAATATNPVIPAFAISPSSVSEFQPNLNATNTNSPSNHAKWGGRSVAITVDPTNTSIAIAASESGGLFRTTDGGKNWAHLEGLQPFRMVDVKIAPSDHNVVLATTWGTADTANPGGVWRSPDGGTTWSQPASAASLCGGNTNGYGISYESGSNYVYAGDDCGLAVSPDLGVTWSQQFMSRADSLTSPSTNTVDVCADDGFHQVTRSGATLTVGATHLINGQGCPGGVYHNLAAAPQEAGVLFSMSVINSTTLCGGTVANPAGLWALYESDDSGSTWNQDDGTMCPSRPPNVVTHVAPGGGNSFTIIYSGGLNMKLATCTANIATTRCTGLPASPNVGNEHADDQEVAFATDSTNCPQYLVSDGGVQTTTDCGANFKMAAGSGGANGNYNALQVYEVNGQVHTDPGTNTDLYFSTQDNDVWGSPDNGVTWPNAICCEGFFLETPHSAANNGNQTITWVGCSGCGNEIGQATFSGCSYNSPPCVAWTNPPVPATSPPTPPTVKVGNPFMIAPKTYIEWGQVNPPNFQLYVAAVTGSFPSNTVTWGSALTAPGGSTFVLAEQLASRFYFSSAPATLYAAYCSANCGFNNQQNGLLKITGFTGANSTVRTLANGSGANTLGFLGTECDGQATFICPSVFGVDPNNPNHLIAADGSTQQMKFSTDAGASWHVDTQLTDLVTGHGRYLWNVPNVGVQPHVIAWDPANGNRILVGTESAGIIASTDGGATWTTMVGSQKTTAVTGFFFDEVKHDIVVSTYGRGLWTLDMTLRPASLDYTGDASGDFNDSAHLSAHLYDSTNGPSTPIIGAKVNITLGSQGCSNLITDLGGNVSCSIVLNQTPGAYTVMASFAGDAQHSAVSTSHTFTINREDTKLTYTGDTTQDFHDPATMSATLADATDSVPIAGKFLSFTLGVGDTCIGSLPTDSSGNASCVIVSTQPAGPTPLVTSFAGDAFFLPASITTTFVIKREETTTTYTGPTVIANGVSTTFSGVLKEDGTVPIAGRTLTITLGSGVTQQSCLTTPTDPGGSGNCPMVPNQPLGPGTVTATFAGDAFYLPSSDTQATILFGFLDRGAFVIGDGNVTVGVDDTYWGAHWARENTLTGGPAPNSFKGFASTTSKPPSCGVGWTTRPGNSSDPPDSVPSYMGVIVSSSIGMDGSTTSGDTVEIVVIKTDPGYDGNPGHVGTGTIVASPSDPTKPAVFCHS
ncbi:MAG TPA: sialidase family protein [Candidatus Dormibacteraeota bacterium]|nr:sialidase family protein [Candidatus Dormibacteraeota bacterium]